MAFWRRETSKPEAPQPVASPATTRTKGGEIRLGRQAIHESLIAACSQHVEAALVAPDTAQVIRCRFHTLDEGIVVLRGHEGTSSSVTTLATCCVTYNLDGRAFVFVTWCRASTMDDMSGRPLFSIAAPESIATLEVRHAFRVPVMSSQFIEASIQRDAHRPLPVELLDLSFSGARISMPSGQEMPEPEESIQLIASLETEGRTIIVNEAVEFRRIDVSADDGRLHCGLFFPDSYGTDSLEPDEPLREMVIELERAWILSRRA